MARFDKYAIFEHNDFITTCIIDHPDYGRFKGVSKCAPEDEDFFSPKIGETLSLMRAEIKFLKFYKNVVLKEDLKLLNSIRYTGKKAPIVNSFINKRIEAFYSSINADIEEINALIKEREEYLKSYVIMKDTYHDLIRARRSK